MQKVQDNVFIIGCPRSGKTLLQSMLAFHEDFAWFSNYVGKFPQYPQLGIINRVYNIPILNNILLPVRDLKAIPHPAELPKKYIPSLRKTGSLEAQDVTQADRQILTSLFATQEKLQKKESVIADEGRPARILFFNEIFPNSKFIHVIRDGREVTVEFLLTRKDWFTKDKDLTAFYQNVPSELTQQLEKYKDHHILVLAALRWQMAILEIERQSRMLDANSFLVIKYESILTDKKEVIDQSLKFLGRTWTPVLSDAVKSKQILSKRRKWQEYLTRQEQRILNKILGGTLKKYNYL